MTDGYIDLALMIYDSEDAPEAQLSGKGPCIHHIGIEVDDPEVTRKKSKLLEELSYLNLVLEPSSIVRRMA